jgi:hypothetical protein
MIVINYHNIITPTLLAFNDSWRLVSYLNQQFGHKAMKRFNHVCTSKLKPHQKER